MQTMTKITLIQYAPPSYNKKDLSCIAINKVPRKTVYHVKPVLIHPL